MLVLPLIVLNLIIILGLSVTNIVIAGAQTSNRANIAVSLFNGYVLALSGSCVMMVACVIFVVYLIVFFVGDSYYNDKFCCKKTLQISLILVNTSGMVLLLAGFALLIEVPISYLSFTLSLLCLALIIQILIDIVSDIIKTREAKQKIINNQNLMRPPHRSTDSSYFHNCSGGSCCGPLPRQKIIIPSQPDQNNSAPDLDEQNLPTIVVSVCSVCLSKQTTHVLIPCGHICLCESCVQLNIKNCPVCRQQITNSIKYYMQ